MFMGADLWFDSWISETEADPVWEKIKPTELLEVFPEEGILLVWGSNLETEMNSGRRSEYENDGAKLEREEPIM